ncbi:acetyl-CoA C-acetyltransferase [Teladorsagia circumcincta]|uniref:Acetyl-CoA C-acetyltransferase n=1 Tax=Teladorsagia circumcincta TaxID=45464 RepID=A0A2G9U1B7_TELCI|nr:acetyl-CoA C-acetyltransferase [Teladorsagia circumcincta]
MSQTPFAVRNTRFGTALGVKYEFEDMLWESLTDTYAKLAMAQTAEKLGAEYKVTRNDADAFALRSQQLWKKAQDAGIYKAEITPMTVKGKKGEETFEGICDGAAAMVVAGDEAIKEHSLKPLARVVSYAAVGCDPTMMGIGPAPAIRQVLAHTGLKIEDIDIFEVNEAFAPQALAVHRELGIPMDKLNLNGGAIALGHPLGASGARISVHLVHELKRRRAKYAIGSACIGGGQGIAVLFENVD